MAFLTATGIVGLFNDVYSSLARKGAMAPQPNFGISPGTPSYPTDLFLPIFAKLFLIILVLIIEVSPWTANFWDDMIAAKDGCIIGI